MYDYDYAVTLIKASHTNSADITQKSQIKIKHKPAKLDLAGHSSNAQ